MLFSNETYKLFDIPKILFRVSTLNTSLHVILSIIRAIVPTLAMALATANFIDTVIAIIEGSQPQRYIYLPLIILLLLLGIFTTIDSIIRLVSIRLRLHFENMIKPSLIRSQAALNFKHIENKDSWELISRLLRNSVMSFMNGYDSIMNVVRIFLNIVTILGLILVHVWWAAFVIVSFSVPMIWLFKRIGEKTYQAERDAEKFVRRAEYFEEILSERESVDERTLFGFGEEITKRWHSQYESARIHKMKVQARTFVVAKSTSLILALVGLLIALALIGPVASGHVTAGMYIGIVGVVFNIVIQLGWQLSDSISAISHTNEYLKDLSVFTALSRDDEVLSSPDSVPIDFNMLEFRNVRFRYPNSKQYVLDGLSFTMKAGYHYAIVGNNGSGKTTIFKLISGLYPEYEGEIMINGKELRKYPASALKALLSIVHQDFARYFISLKDNIKLGDLINEHDTEQIFSAAKLAGIEGLIAELGNGIETPLGRVKEGGKDISGGQWQRVAIARSLISRAPIKILDEPTAALDPIAESVFYGELDKLMKGKTAIFITHRLGSIKLADEILVIGNGQMIECGTHDELLEKGGEYAEMFDSQRNWYQ